MSKSTKNQKSITSFFKNPAQPAPPQSKAPPPVEIKKEKEEPIQKLSSSSPPPGPAPEPTAKAFISVKKPAVIISPRTINERQPINETDWINLSDRFY